MALTEFTFKLIILCIPGITWYMLLSRLVGKFNKDSLEKILIIFLFAGLVYVVYGGLFCYGRNALCYHGYKSPLMDCFFGNNIKIDIWDLFGLEVTAILLAFFSSYAYTYNWLNRIAQCIKATNRYGDEDVWENFNNRISGKWVFVRDHKLNLIYLSSIDLWSDSEKSRELVLSDVAVFNNAEEKIYEVDKLYISRNIDDLTIEIPKPTNNIEVPNGKTT